MSVYKKIPYILLLVLLAGSLFAQKSYKGIPNIYHFSTSNSFGPDNWASVQDTNGVMFFGNKRGLLKFDGADWRLYQANNRTTIRALNIGDDGTIYYGAQGEFGKLSIDRKGEYYLESLLDSALVEDNKISGFWSVFEVKGGVVFQTFEKIFYVKKDTTIVYSPEKQFYFKSYVLNDEYYVADEARGLLKLTDNGLEYIGGKEIFKDDWLSGVFDLPDGRIIVATSKNGLFEITDNGLKKLNTAFDDFLMSAHVYCGAKYNGYYVLGSIKDGLLIFDENLNAIYHINESRGLTKNSVHRVYFDKAGCLWACLNNGIDYIELNSPFTIIGESLNLKGTGYHGAVFEDNLFLTTNQGLYSTVGETNINSPISYNAVKNTNGQAWYLSVLNDELFLGHDAGVFEIIDDYAFHYSDGLGGWEMQVSKQNPDYYLAGTYYGFFIFNKEKSGENVFIKSKKIFEDSFRVFEQDDDGTIWVSHGYKGAYKIRLNESLDSIAELTFYDKSKGFPTNFGINVFKINGENLWGTEKGVYVYNKETDLFEQKDYYTAYFGNRFVKLLVEDEVGNIWYSVDDEIGVLRKKQLNGAYTKESSIFNKIGGQLLDNFEFILPIDEENVIFGVLDGFVHYNPSYEKKIPEFPVSISKIELIKNDSLLFSGIERPDKKAVELLHKYNSLRFSFSAQFYENIETTTYSYLLKGYDDGWSSWSSRTEKEYTNLPEGEYVFMVKAKNIYDKESCIDRYSFEIKPPWGRTIWAFLIYILGAIIIVILIVRVYTRRLEAEKIKLEEIVEERTAEIRFQNKQISEQAEELRSKNEEISLNNEILAKSKAIIEKKNKSITASINYASHIQGAILPKIEVMQELVDDCFVLFKPRDIVSGDFYWFAQIREKLVFAAADCTGHGVPGALLSMMGNEILNELIKNRKITDPDKILKKLHQGIVLALKQDSTDNLDGMDISVCVYDASTQTIEYSGALNPAIVITNGELTKYEGDVVSIGGLGPKDRDYTKHSIKVEKGSCIYLYSDGFIDQFGGEKNKKFTETRLLDIIQEVCNETCDIQKAILETKLQDWMKDERQLDDILVLGIKV